MAESIIRKKEGQSLVEILIAAAVGAIIVGSAAGALIFTVRSNQQNLATDTASYLSQELLDNLRSVAEGKWRNIYDLTKGASTKHSLAVLSVLNGTVAVTSGFPSVNGSGTAFLSNLVAGDKVIINSLPFTVSIVNSDILLTLSTNYSGSNASGLSITRDFSMRDGTVFPEQITYNNIVFTRYFVIENVNRDSCGTGQITSADQVLCSPSKVGILDDPSTQKVTTKVTWPQGSDTTEVLVSEYLTRSNNEVNQFRDWNGGPGVEGPITQPSNSYSSQSGLDATTTQGTLRLLVPASSGWLESSTFDTGYLSGVAYNSIMWKGNLGIGPNAAVKFQIATSNDTSGASGGEPVGPIDFTNRYAWNSIVGWLDFYGAPGGPATINTSKMTRWATSLDGDFALDCATTPGGNVCAASNFYVSDSTGNLAGWAWNDAYGWVSFCGNSTSGSTWNGSTWVCPASPTYQVTINQTNGDFSGWAWNDIIGWVSFCGGAGTANCPGSVAYKVKVASAGSGWNYVGPDGSNSSFYVSTADIGQGEPLPVVTARHNNQRYYRYKIYLESGGVSPVVEDVIVNWSP